MTAETVPSAFRQSIKPKIESVILFQGEAVPRNQIEVANPDLIRIRVARELLERVAAVEGQDPIIGIDNEIIAATFPQVSSNVRELRPGTS